jgi:hypothetical protein
MVALLDDADPDHAACVQTTDQLPSGPLVTTWPCFTEAMHLVFRSGGFAAQAELWKLRSTGKLILHDLGDAEVKRMAELMEKYRDLPMDLADASLVAAAERLGNRRVFTLDKDFFVYRFADGSAVEVIR